MALDSYLADVFLIFFGPDHLHIPRKKLPEDIGESWADTIFARLEQNFRIPEPDGQILQ